MRRFAFILALAAMAACGKTGPIPQDRLLDVEGEPLDGYEVVVSSESPEAYPGMTLRSVSFVNTGDKPLVIGAMETSRIEIEAPAVWSLQPSSTGERKDWVLPVEDGFYQRNFMGMNDSDYGGGIPMVCLWTPSVNRSVGVAEDVLKLVSIPVERKGDKTWTWIRQDFEEPITLEPGQTLEAVSQFILESEGDFFEPLRMFAKYQHEEYGWDAPVSPEEAYEAVWCAWGYERTFTVDEVIGTLPKVVELGFKWVDVDDGYQICEGDWQANDRIGPDGMRRMTDAIHAAGLKAKLWWTPLCADPESSLAKEHPEMLLVQKDGTHEDISWWDSWYLSPLCPATWEYTEGLVDMFLDEWGFDGFKLDGQHLNLAAPDYNPACKEVISYPEQSCYFFPEFFAHIYYRAQFDKPDAVIQICPCGCAVNFFNLPYMNQAVASDPTSSAQIRMKRKVYAALCPDLAYYADHVELSDGGLDFPSQIGVGGIIGTKFTWPEPNPDATENGGSLLTPEKEALLRKWVPIYNEKMLSKGEYLNLYDFGFDKPETHVIAKDGALYYAFYAPSWNGEPITLRGLDPDKTYTVTEYAADDPKSFEISGADPVIRPRFEGSYLIEVQ